MKQQNGFMSVTKWERLGRENFSLKNVEGVLMGAGGTYLETEVPRRVVLLFRISQLMVSSGSERV